VSEPGSDDTADNDKGSGGKSSGPYNLSLRGGWVNFSFDDIHSKNGGGGIEHRSQRADDGAENGSKYKAGDTGRDEFFYQHGEGLVGICHLSAVELPCDDAGQDNNKRYQQLQTGCNENAELALFEALCRECPLGDELVYAPVVEVRNPQAEEQCCPWQNFIICGQYHMQPILVFCEEVSEAIDLFKPEEQCDGAADNKT